VPRSVELVWKPKPPKRRDWEPASVAAESADAYFQVRGEQARRQVAECQVEVASNLLEGVEVCDPAFRIPSADDPEVVGQSGTTIARVRTWRWVQLFLTRQRAVSPNRPRDIAAASVMPYTPNRAPRSFRYSRSKPLKRLTVPVPSTAWRSYAAL
jgi:hypothetical protein